MQLVQVTTSVEEFLLNSLALLDSQSGQFTNCPFTSIGDGLMELGLDELDRSFPPVMRAGGAGGAGGEFLVVGYFRQLVLEMGWSFRQ